MYPQQPMMQPQQPIAEEHDTRTFRRGGAGGPGFGGDRGPGGFGGDRGPSRDRGPAPGRHSAHRRAPA